MAQWLFHNTYSFTYSLFPSLFEVFLFFLMLGPPEAIFWTSALAIIFFRAPTITP